MKAKNSFKILGLALVAIAFLNVSSWAEDTDHKQDNLSVSGALSADSSSHDAYGLGSSSSSESTASQETSAPVASTTTPSNTTSTSTASVTTTSSDSSTAPNATAPSDNSNAAPAQAGSAAANTSGAQNTTASSAQAASEEKDIIVTQVNIAGNQIISTSTILNKVKTRVGEPIRQEVVSQDIKNLYATGFFKDVKFDLVMDGADKVKVNVVVEEKPIIKQIIIEGSSVFKADALRKDLNLSEGQIFDPKALQEGVNAIQAKYQNKGFRFVDIKPEVDVNPVLKEATIFILISEGDKFKIKEIKYEGVKAFKLGQIKALVKTRKKEWFFSGVFKEEKFNEDLDRIQTFYQSEGYLDVRVESHFDYDYKTKEIIVTIKIDEGKRYITGDIIIKGNHTFPKLDLEEVLKMKNGKPYSQLFLRKDIEALRQFYFDQGYINVQIIPDIQMNKTSGRVDVTYNLAEGDLYYVQKVKIRGNRKTKDFVIRRELRVRPGEKLSGKKLELSKQRLENLDYFESVDYEFEPSGAAANKEDVVFRVKEKQTGELSFGAGFSSVDSFVGFAQISQRNFDLMNWPSFVGAGQYASLRGRLGNKTRDVDFTFTEPYLFGNPYSLTVNIYDLDREAINTDFDTLRFGASVTLGKQFSDAVRGSIGYTLEHVELKNLEDNVANDSNTDVFKSKDGRFLSRLKFTLSRDTRDNVNNPTTGWYLSAQTELVGGPLGGDNSFYSWLLSATRYWTFKPGHTIEFRNRAGVMSPLFGDEFIPVSERFYAGGLGSIRGYGYRNVGPKQYDKAIGGDTMFITNVEYSFPLFSTFKGVVFVDAGEVNYHDYEFFNTDNFAVGVGPGLKMKTPIGPIALYYGYPIFNPDPENEHGRFEFSFSRGF